VLGSARSGTTKFAELLCSKPGSRLLMEPMHILRSRIAPPSFTWGEYLEPGTRRLDLRDAWLQCLNGRVRDAPWIDRHNTARLVRRRLVKSIAGTNLAAWLRHEFPSVQIAYIVRHPFAVATSVLQLQERDLTLGRGSDWSFLTSEGLDTMMSDSGLLGGPLASEADQIRAIALRATDPFDRSVLRWCLENVLVLRSAPAGVRVVFYERLFGRPSIELRDAAYHLRLPLGRAARRAVDQPSRTDFRRASQSERRFEARLGDWVRDLPVERERAGLEILDAFGLTRYYGPDPLPLCTVVPVDNEQAFAGVKGSRCGTLIQPGNPG
jgi:hypothetical protein